eukprot:2446110-Rhodomonas_salina.1
MTSTSSLGLLHYLLRECSPAPRADVARLTTRTSSCSVHDAEYTGTDVAHVTTRTSLYGLELFASFLAVYAMSSTEKAGTASSRGGEEYHA